MPLKGQEEILARCIEAHGDRYDYSKFQYTGYRHKSCIICHKHGEFWMKPSDHYTQKQGCPKCGEESRIKKRTYTLEKFIATLSEELREQLDFSNTVYRGMHTPIELRCKIHNIVFSTDPGSMRYQNKNYCPKCCEPMYNSKGEDLIAEYLTLHQIDYIPQYKVVIEGSNHFFDFYLPDHNTIIEFHGQQHYKPIDWFGGEEAFLTQQERDDIKRNYCEDNDIKLVEIPYKELTIVATQLEKII